MMSGLIVRSISVKNEELAVSCQLSEGVVSIRLFRVASVECRVKVRES